MTPRLSVRVSQGWSDTSTAVFIRLGGSCGLSGGKASGRGRSGAWAGWVTPVDQGGATGSSGSTGMVERSERRRPGGSRLVSAGSP